MGELSQKLIDFGQQSLEAFREVDEGMDVIITKTGTSGKALEGMQDIATELATSIPTDFATAGSAVRELNTQFGLTGDALSQASALLIKYAEINGSDVTQSAISARQAIETYSLESKDLAMVLDTVTFTSQQTGVGVQDLMSKVVSGAPQIKSLRLSSDEGVALMGRFEKAGVDSSAALSTLSKAAVNYAKDGLTLQDGLAKTVEQIKNSTNETESLTFASEVFGSKATPRMVDAIKRGAFSFNDLSGTAKNALDVVNATYEATLEPIDKFTTAQNTAKAAMAEVGGVLAETLAPVLVLLAQLLQSVANWFSNLSSPIQDFIIIMGGMITIVGVLLPGLLALQAAATAIEIVTGQNVYAYRNLASLGRGYETITELHFNDFNGQARGSEVLIYAGYEADNLDKKLLSILAKRFVNCGFKPVDWLYNANVVADQGYNYRLVEISFIDNNNDMAIYEQQKDSMAREFVQAISGQVVSPPSPARASQSSYAHYHVGDSVIVQAHATHYQTGQAISTWVKGKTFKIIRVKDVNQSHSKKAYLLEGINSWVLEQDVKGTSQGHSEQTYAVRSGDTLSAIAKKFNTTYQELDRINGIANPNIISVGQVLCLK